MTEKEKIAFDREHLWHPYSSMTSPRLAFHAVSAEGCRIQLADGREVIDGISSWWAMAHGHRHPKIVRAMREQLEVMPHVMFGGFTHDPVIKLGKLMLELLPAGLERIFFSDSGSVACEVAMKMALQYAYARGEVAKQKFITVEHSYHGDTFATMALGGDGMHSYFGHLLTQHFIAPAPTMGFDDFDPHNIAELRAIFEQHHHGAAAMILEPVLQGAGGMRIYSPRYLQEARKLCDEFGVLLIFDEIATGFGRTGAMFAADHAGVSPDIICVGKALTGGHITLAATVATSIVADTISGASPYALMHGPTYMASPIACAAATASLELFGEYDWHGCVKSIENQLADELAPLRNIPGVAGVRVLGAVGAVELKSAPNADAVSQKFVDLGCWVRPFGNIVYLMPPFVISEDELSKLTWAMNRVLKEV